MYSKQVYVVALNAFAVKACLSVLLFWDQFSLIRQKVRGARHGQIFRQNEDDRNRQTDQLAANGQFWLSTEDIGDKDTLFTWISLLAKQNQVKKPNVQLFANLARNNPNIRHNTPREENMKPPSIPAPPCLAETRHSTRRLNQDQRFYVLRSSHKLQKSFSRAVLSRCLLLPRVPGLFLLFEVLLRLWVNVFVQCFLVLL